ncbi:MAG: GNAT family N-acetyltransferase [Anaerolineales bacterium]
MESTINAKPAGQVIIQSASWRDLIGVRQLEEICFPTDSWPLLEIIGALTMPGVVRVKAILDNQIVGFAAGDYRKSEDIAWIATIGVLPEYRRQGIGERLLRECEARLDKPRVRLCVRASNEPAIRLYHGAGYKQVGVWSGYYQDKEDALVLEKQIERVKA